MPERPPIRDRGRIVEELEPDRLYRVEMANGYRAYAILEKKGPSPPAKALDCGVAVDFSPYDMSRCRIVSWGDRSAESSSTDPAASLT